MVGCALMVLVPGALSPGRASLGIFAIVGIGPTDVVLLPSEDKGLLRTFGPCGGKHSFTWSPFEAPSELPSPVAIVPA